MTIMSLCLLGLRAWSDFQSVHDALGELCQGLENTNYRILYDQRRRGWATRVTERVRDPRLDLHYLPGLTPKKTAGSSKPEALSYPQGADDVDRTTEAFVGRLNETYFTDTPGTGPARTLIEVRRKENGQLGVLAKEEIPANTTIHMEEPSARGHF